jgi:hypothetical protein
MMKMYRELRRNAPEIMRKAGGHSMFTARVYSDLCFGAAAVRKKYLEKV